MEDKTAKEIQRLKKEIYKKKEEIHDIKQLVNKDIDREFHTEIWELSEREFNTFVGEDKPFINKYPELKLDTESITSPRKILGRPLIFIKRILFKLLSTYINENFDKQTLFNRQINASNQALYEALLRRFKQDNEKMRRIRERISDCEESLVIILNKLNDLQEQDP